MIPNPLDKKNWDAVAKWSSDGRAVGGVYVTTSWDDGHVLDHKMAALLDQYQLPGTFYVAPRNIEFPQREWLGDRGIRALAADYEIGGHTLTHLRLPTLPSDVARREIVEGKDYLEQLLGESLRSFCYVGGEYQPQHVEMVREAGFATARTVERYVTGPTPPLEMATTMHAYRHLVDGPTVARMTTFRPDRMRNFFFNWDELAVDLFDRILVTGGVFHLWGHSWEVERNGDWDRLERVMAHISRRPDIRYVDNGQLGAVMEGLVS